MNKNEITNVPLETVAQLADRGLNDCQDEMKRRARDVGLSECQIDECLTWKEVASVILSKAMPVPRNDLEFHDETKLDKAMLRLWAACKATRGIPTHRLLTLDLDRLVKVSRDLLFRKTNVRDARKELAVIFNEKLEEPNDERLS